MTIGNRDTARMLYDYFNSDNYRERAPKGFRRIGAGCYRTAYLETNTNTVYKVGDYTANVSEAAVARRLRRRSTRSLGFQLRIPETRTYAMPSYRGYSPFSGPYVERQCVSAQEYAANAVFTECASQDDWMEIVPDCNCGPRTSICFKVIHDRVREFSGLSDIHSENILMDSDNVFWLIDLAD